MAPRNHYSGKRHKASNPPPKATPTVKVPFERKPPTVYGKPFILLEDEGKNTFVYQAGSWVAHAMSVAEYRVSSQVKALPQKVNGMIRYEIRSPVAVSS